jgi:hypothetical protein
VPIVRAMLFNNEMLGKAEREDCKKQGNLLIRVGQLFPHQTRPQRSIEVLVMGDEQRYVFL